MDNFLESLSNWKVTWLNDISVVRARHSLANEATDRALCDSKWLTGLKTGPSEVESAVHAFQYQLELGGLPALAEVCDSVVLRIESSARTCAANGLNAALEPTRALDIRTSAVNEGILPANSVAAPSGCAIASLAGGAISSVWLHAEIQKTIPIASSATLRSEIDK